MTLIEQLACKWCERENALGYKGKRADALCLEYFVGAAVALEATGQAEAAGQVGRFMAMCVAIRGALEVRRIAHGAQQKAA